MNQGGVWGAGSVRGPPRWSPASAHRPAVCFLVWSPRLCGVVGCWSSPSVASSRPREGAVLVLSVLRFFVVLVVFSVEEFFLLSSVLLSLLGSCLLCDQVFGDFLMDSVFGPFCGIFSMLRSAR